MNFQFIDDDNDFLELELEVRGFVARANAENDPEEKRLWLDRASTSHATLFGAVQGSRLPLVEKNWRFDMLDALQDFILESDNVVEPGFDGGQMAGPDGGQMAGPDGGQMAGPDVGQLPGPAGGQLAVEAPEAVIVPRNHEAEAVRAQAAGLRAQAAELRAQATELAARAEALLEEANELDRNLHGEGGPDAQEVDRDNEEDVG